MDEIEASDSRRRARPRDRLQHGRGPVAVRRLRDGFDGEALRVGAGNPFQHRRGVVVLQHQHARAARDRQHLAGDRDAVSDRRHERDVGCIRADQGGGRGTRALVLLVRESRRRASTAGPCATTAARAGLLCGARQRAPAGRVQVGDIGRDIEESAL